MKKKDKVKSGIRMAVGLLLTVCMIFAGALLGGAMKAEAVAPTIDFTKTDGSITIHKYEYNGTGGEQGTGQESDKNKVPTTGDDAATELEDVEFTLYKVKDADALKAIYQGISADAMPELSTYWNSTDEKLTSAGEALSKISAKKTGSNGEVKFDNLPVGIYLVVETDVPPNVTKKSAFLVSIPTTINENDWLYDVHVFPKNATTYGKKVTLLKKGKDGTTETDLNGVTFVLQRKKVEKGEDNKDIVTWEPVTVTGKGDPVTLTTANGKIEVSDLPPGTYRFMETGIGDNTGYIADLSKAYEFVVNENGKIEKSDDDDDDSYIKINADGSAEITVINHKPDVDKKVKDKDGNWVQEADYSVGDTISYQIAIKVPENIAKLKTFKVQDTPNGIEYKSGTLKVYEAAADGNMDATKEITAGYTVTEGTPTNGFTVEFTLIPTPGKITDYAGKTICITYNAVLTDGAVVNAGNTNTVKLIYSNQIKPEDSEDEEPPSEDEIEDSTVVYTFQLDITKNGKTDSGEEPLQGVTFDLYKETTDADTDKIADADAKAAGLDTSKKWKKINSAALETDENGKISVEGLAKGIYYLVETQTNDGYNLLSKPIKVELTTKYKTDFKDTYTDDNGVIIKHEVEVKEDGTSITQEIKVNDGNNVVDTVTILNTKGFTLPTTGGAGGFLFAVVGCVVMIVGIILFKGTKKKPESE